MVSEATVFHFFKKRSSSTLLLFPSDFYAQQPTTFEELLSTWKASTRRRLQLAPAQRPTPQTHSTWRQQQTIFLPRQYDLWRQTPTGASTCRVPQWCMEVCSLCFSINSADRSTAEAMCEVSARDTQSTMTSTRVD